LSLLKYTYDPGDPENSFELTYGWTKEGQERKGDGMSGKDYLETMLMKKAPQLMPSRTWTELGPRNTDGAQLMTQWASNVLYQKYVDTEIC